MRKESLVIVSSSCVGMFRLKFINIINIYNTQFKCNNNINITITYYVMFVNINNVQL